MENQHRKITGYRELQQHEIDLMNEIKEAGAMLEALTAKVKDHINDQAAGASIMTGSTGDKERRRIDQAEPVFWYGQGKTDLQTGLMALTRAVAQPTSF